MRAPETDSLDFWLKFIFQILLQLFYQGIAYFLETAYEFNMLCYFNLILL